MNWIDDFIWICPKCNKELAVHPNLCVPCQNGWREEKESRDEKVYFFEPLEKEISVEDLQKIVDANEKLVKELKDADR